MKRWLKRLLGYRECPICHHQSVKWVHDPILFADEPPIMGHWQCFNPECLAQTEIESLPWADRIAQEHGYKTYKEVLEHIANDSRPT